MPFGCLALYLPSLTFLLDWRRKKKKEKRKRRQMKEKWKKERKNILFLSPSSFLSSLSFFPIPSIIHLSHFSSPHFSLLSSHCLPINIFPFSFPLFVLPFFLILLLPLSLLPPLYFPLSPPLNSPHWLLTFTFFPTFLLFFLCLCVFPSLPSFSSSFPQFLFVTFPLTHPLPSLLPPPKFPSLSPR